MSERLLIENVIKSDLKCFFFFHPQENVICEFTLWKGCFWQAQRQTHTCLWSFLSTVCEINFRERSPHSPDSENIQNIISAIKPEEVWKAVSEPFLAEFKGHITASLSFFLSFLFFSFPLSFSSMYSVHLYCQLICKSLYLLNCKHLVHEVIAFSEYRQLLFVVIFSFESFSFPSFKEVFSVHFFFGTHSFTNIHSHAGGI